MGIQAAAVGVAELGQENLDMRLLVANCDQAVGDVDKIRLSYPILGSPHSSAVDALAALHGTYFRGLALGNASLATEGFVDIEAASSSATLGSMEFSEGPSAIADALGVATLSWSLLVARGTVSIGLRPRRHQDLRTRRRQLRRH